ncbi:RES domain-containing protein [Sphingomonas laterariae]|uniref:RES domain-containing protein n=1 Tax=Edaphosphingomonas laterariae TaxID=861865 RepID=A0A239DZH4_9SPHN|nr:RES family NAD+ phosphorylase [Sphingomonas laterariae]SNS37856.1 RES domain-containing protein [Sphingomonas laterariae]
MLFWRISEYAVLDGMGGMVAAGRWNERGRPIVYMADSSALAMLEVLVHLEVRMIPPPFQLLEIAVPDDIAVEEAPAALLDTPAESAAWGSAWLAERRTALLRAPSIIAPGGFNWLLNPLHPDAAGAQVTRQARWPWDSRLFPA